jgi:hypothetical protein
MAKKASKTVNKKSVKKTPKIEDRKKTISIEDRKKITHVYIISAKEALDVTNKAKRDRDEKWFIEIQNIVDGTLTVINEEVITAAKNGLNFVELDHTHSFLFSKESYANYPDVNDVNTIAFDKVTSVLEDYDYDIVWDGFVTGYEKFKITWE